MNTTNQTRPRKREAGATNSGRKTTAKPKRKEKPADDFRVSRQDIDVSKLDWLILNLVNAQGEELLSLHFDRTADVLPQIKIDVLDGSDIRKLRTGIAVFDITA